MAGERQKRRLREMERILSRLRVEHGPDVRFNLMTLRSLPEPKVDSWMLDQLSNPGSPIA